MKASISPLSVASRRENRVPADKLCDAAITMQAFKKHTYFRNAFQKTAYLTVRQRKYSEQLGSGLGVWVSAKNELEGNVMVCRAGGANPTWWKRGQQIPNNRPHGEICDKVAVVRRLSMLYTGSMNQSSTAASASAPALLLATNLPPTTHFLSDWHA